jgi:hypothetical protein
MLCSATVSALQIVFSDSLYESTAQCETGQIFKANGLLVLKVMATYTDHGKTSSAGRNCG